MPDIVEGRAGLESILNKELGPSAWVQITQDKINSFADAIEDYEWLHVDVERSKASKYGNTIAQGFLTAALTPGLLRSLISVTGFGGSTNYGVNRVRFVVPVICDAKVRLRASLIQLEEVKNGVQATYRSTMELEGSEKPAAVVENLLRYFD